MSHGRADDTCKGEQVRNTDQHSQHSPFHPGSSQCGHFKSLNMISARSSICRGCRLGCADWQVSGVTTLVTPVTSVPPLLLSTGPSRHHRRDRYCNQHRLHNTKYTLNFGFIIIFCNVQIIFWMYKNISAVVSNSGLSSAGAGAGVWRAERRVRTSVTTFSVTNGQGIPNEASPRRHNYTLHQPEIRHVSIVRQNARRRSCLAFIPKSNWVVCLQQCMP